MIDGVVFWALGVVSVAAGIAVFKVDSMARATYALAVSFVAVGLVLLLFDLDYVGLIVVLMMVMEMAVMAVYMLMFMGMNPALMPMSMVHGHRTAIVAGVGSFLVLAAGALLVPWPSRAGAPGADITRELGETLMGSKMLAMLTISPVMLATIVAGVSLAAHRTRYDRLGDDLSGPTNDPQPGGVGRSRRQPVNVGVRATETPTSAPTSVPTLHTSSHSDSEMSSHREPDLLANIPAQSSGAGEHDEHDEHGHDPDGGGDPHNSHHDGPDRGAEPEAGEER